VAYALFKLSAANNPSAENKANEGLVRLLPSMSPREVQGGKSLTRELQKSGNLLKALDEYVSSGASR
jgi:hypothetical protein